MVSAILYWVQVIFWLAALQTRFYETAPVEEVEILRIVASELGVPSETWNFSTDPCLNNWTGIVCCVENSTNTDCCASYTPYYNSGAVPCDTSPEARLSALILHPSDFGYTWKGTLSNSFCNLTSLVNLDLGGNLLRGEIPECIGSRLSNLRYISIRDNLLNGSIPKNLGALSKLRAISLENNKLEGEIPQEIFQLKNLTSLNLASNNFKGEIPKEIFRLKNLTSLNLASNNFTGKIPKEIFHLSNLDTLSLYENKLEGIIPKEIVQLKNLKDLELGNNKLEGEIPKEIFQLSNLDTLWLYDNKLEGNIPKEIVQLKNLTHLSLASNKLEGEMPKEIFQLSSLERLKLDNNKLEGDIPKELGQLKNLYSLSLASNNLKGEIPEEIGQLSMLKYLYLQVNKLTGGIPSSFSSLVSLRYLNLYSNQLSGEISPSTFQNMSNLQVLNLGFNNFSGSIPDMGGPGKSLRDLFLGHNNLSGGIPASFSTLSNLARLDLSHNMLVGSLENLNVINKLTSLELDISFNFFNISTGPYSITKQRHPSINAFFNCNSNSSSCLRSSPGKEIFFAVNSGGNNITNLNENGNQMRFDGDKDLNYLNSSVGLFYGIGSWALEVSGDAGGTYNVQVEAPVNISGAGNWASQELYSSMRWSSNYIGYHGYNLRSGLYTVTLHFAELVFLEPGYRMFDVMLQGQVLVKNLDIVSIVGPRAAHRIESNIRVTNGSVSVELVHSGTDRYLRPADAWPVQSSGPIISGISVVYRGQVAGSTHRLSSSQIAEIVSGSGLGILVLAVVLCLFIRRKRERLLFVYSIEAPSQPGFVEASLGAGGAMSYQELFNATQGFSEKIGEGGFGAVYKGTLPTGALIAVKQLVKNKTRLSKHSSQIQEDFHREISIISKVRHRNLLAVIGHSLESDIPMLVCEFIPNGSLDRWLWKKEQVLSWEVRRKIAIGVSCGLAYLHDESASKIIHCDVKPANILLDSDFNPRIADFGLARLYDEKQTHVTETRLKGTAGYLAPEYVMQLQLSEKVDVYSFGVVLLELLSGRHAVEIAAPTEQIVLVDWARTGARVPENLLDIMDKRLQGMYVKQEARDMVNIAILCTQSSASLRPKMRSVWLMLNGTIRVPDFLEDLEADTHFFTTSVEATSSSS